MNELWFHELYLQLGRTKTGQRFDNENFRKPQTNVYVDREQEPVKKFKKVFA